MSGKIVLNLAISLDGYIADENGGFEWIVGDGNSALNTDLKWDYKKFLEEIDIVVMGLSLATYLAFPNFAVTLLSCYIFSKVTRFIGRKDYRDKILDRLYFNLFRRERNGTDT